MQASLLLRSLNRIFAAYLMQYPPNMLRKLLCVSLSAALLSAGWLGGSGLTLLVAFVPLLFVSASYGPSVRDLIRMAGWAALTFVLWNIATIGWVWNAAPVGVFAATFFSGFWSLAAFLLYHYVSKRSPKPVAYTLFVAAWVAGEYLYTHAEVISFPWLTLGNGFSGSPWAVQWYEWTGVMGGSVWALACNLAVFEAVRSRRVRDAVRAAVAAAVPIVVSLIIYANYEPEAQSVEIAVVQPNVDCYEEKFSGSEREQLQNLLDLLDETPRDARIVVMPETALPEQLRDDAPQSGATVRALRQRIDSLRPETMIVAGASTVKLYGVGEPRSETARAGSGFYYDIYNSAVAVNGDTDTDVHHKMRLVIGVEAMPFRRLLGFVDLGGVTGQLGRNDRASVFEKGGVKAGPAICYEGLYGDSFAEFVRAGAETMIVMSNDGWWGDTAGHRRLFDFCRLRAIETRRGIARSANTGVSGFITSRGDVTARLDWDMRGVLTSDVEVSSRRTAYVDYGDWVGRLALLLTALSLLCHSAYRIRRKNHLVN